MEMQIVKTTDIQKQFRSTKRKGNDLIRTVKDLRANESLVISAKSADKWKVPANALRSIINYGYKTKNLPRNAKFAVKCLKSGSYAIVRLSN